MHAYASDPYAPATNSASGSRGPMGSGPPSWYVDRPVFARSQTANRGGVEVGLGRGSGVVGGGGVGGGRLFPDGVAPATDPNAPAMIKTMSGETIPASDFRHNNMTPFFGGSVKQNMDLDRHAGTLELHTGTSSVEQRKRDGVPAMFQPARNMSLPYGSQSLPEDLREVRYNTSLYRQGEKPAYEQRVGPGLNQGYVGAPTGGFQQADVRDYALPKTVDELRVATNPKTTYTTPVVRGVAPHKKPGKQAQIRKHNPDRFYVNTPDRYNTTTGAVKGRKLRSRPVDKFTHRTQTSREHTGPAGNREQARERSRTERHVRTTEPFRAETALDDDGVRNATGGERWGDIDAFTGTYGKAGIEMLPNERDTTQLTTYLSNAMTFVKEMVKPLEDVMRTSRKENVIGNPRPSGNMGGGLQKPTVYDPNDVARTTLKETQIHDSRTGNVSDVSRRAPTVYDPNDIARTTIKETQILDTRIGNVQKGAYKLATYDPNDVARTTLKETQIHDTRTGNVNDVSRRAPTVYDPNDVARTTLKETQIHDTRTGNVNDASRRAPTVYDPNDIARTTLKETQIHDNRLGQISAQPSGDAQGGKQYGTVAFLDEAKTTIRETVAPESSDVNVTVDVPRPLVYDPNDVLRTTIKETNIEHTRQGNVTGLDSRAGYTTNPKQAPNTHRQFDADHEYTGAAGVAEGQQEGGYQVADAYAPPTHRHDLSDREYTGTAQADTSAPTSYEDAYNARTDEVKELIAEGRAPTQTGAKAFPDKSAVCMAQKDDHDRTNQRDLTNTRVDSVSLGKQAYASTTKEKMTLATEAERNQLDPALLTAFKANPYTQPLDSAAL